MAKELQGESDIGATCYFLLRNSVGAIWNGSAFETYAAANYANYDIAATEQGSSGLFTADMPAVAAGTYNVQLKRQAGGSPAESDKTAADGTIMWDGTAIVTHDKLFTTQMTEAYAADGVAPTLAQCLCLVQQSLHEFAINGTTRTVKKLDGSTTAATFTLDSSTDPTSTTRAT